MIDLHCHLLYGLDDGAKNFEESFSLCESAVENSIKAIVATPHFADYLNVDEFIKRREYKADELRSEIDKKDMDIGIGTGAELFLCDDIFLIDDFKDLSINQSRYVLCEYRLPPFDPKYAVIYAENIASRGYVPVIAHPERYLTFLENPWIVDDLIDMGAIFQVNVPSLAGKGGETVKSFATDMVLSGKAKLMGTDAHSPTSRPNDFINCRQSFDERITKDMINLLTCKNPLKVISDQEL